MTKQGRITAKELSDSISTFHHDSKRTNSTGESLFLRSTINAVNNMFLNNSPLTAIYKRK